MDYFILNANNFILYAAKHYNNPQCYDDDEFFEDIKKFKYIKRLFNKYNDTGEIKERLVLNHIIVISNLFGPVAGAKMLLFKLDNFHEILIPFLKYLNISPNILYTGNEEYTNLSDILIDDNIINRLKKLDTESRL